MSDREEMGIPSDWLNKLCLPDGGHAIGDVVFIGATPVILVGGDAYIPEQPQPTLRETLDEVWPQW